MKTKTCQKRKKEYHMEEDLLKDIALCVEFSDEVVKQIRNGSITEISVEINEKNQFRLLTNVDGHVVMNVDRMPRKDYSCFYYNHGVFPYEIKETLNFIGINGEHDSCFTNIVGIEVVPRKRFCYQGPDVPIVEDPRGDSCVWEVHFELVPVLKDFKHFLMRWEADDDTFTDENLAAFMKRMERGTFQMDWLISDWEEVRRGDLFYMMRTGDDRAGIVMNGQIISDPYRVQSLSGKFDHAMCVDVLCMNVVKPGGKPHLSLKELQEAIPEFDWEKGPSGELLSKEVADKLSALWYSYSDYWNNPDYFDLEDLNLDNTYLN